METVDTIVALTFMAVCFTASFRKNLVEIFPQDKAGVHREGK